MNELTEILEFYHRVLPACQEFYKKYPLNEFWGGLNLRTMQAALAGERSLEGIIHAAQRTLMFSVSEEGAAQALAVAWLLKERQERMVGFSGASLQESEHTYPPLVVNVDGLRYTPDFLRCVNIAAEIDGVMGRSWVTVELGAGLGHLARVMLLSGVSARHVIIDLPETLVFSYAFLRKNFPEARLLLVEPGSEASVALAAREFDIAFVPVAYAEVVLPGTPLDLFLNTASLGEMNNATIRYWMNFVQEHLRPRYLFTLNRFLNTITSQLAWRREENECAQHYDAHWEILKWELEPTYTRCPYVDTRISRYVEIIARRSPVTSLTSVAARAVLQQVQQEDWWRLRAQGHVMGMRDNPICVDGTMSGTLFKLWEALRLCPSQEAVEMLLTYLSRLCRSTAVEFEEVSYYRRLARMLMVAGK